MQSTWHAPLVSVSLDPLPNGVSNWESPQLEVPWTCLKVPTSYRYHAIALGPSLMSLGNIALTSTGHKAAQMAPPGLATLVLGVVEVLGHHS